MTLTRHEARFQTETAIEAHAEAARRLAVVRSDRKAAPEDIAEAAGDFRSSHQRVMDAVEAEVETLIRESDG